MIGGRFDSFKLTDFQKNKGFIMEEISTLNVYSDVGISAHIYAKNKLYFSVKGQNNTYCTINPFTGEGKDDSFYLGNTYGLQIYTNENDRIQYKTGDSYLNSIDTELRTVDTNFISRPNQSGVTVYFEGFLYLCYCNSSKVGFYKCELKKNAPWTNVELALPATTNYYNSIYPVIYNKSLHFVGNSYSSKKYVLYRVDTKLNTLSYVSEINHLSDPNYGLALDGGYIVKDDNIFGIGGNSLGRLNFVTKEIFVQKLSCSYVFKDSEKMYFIKNESSDTLGQVTII